MAYKKTAAMASDRYASSTPNGTTEIHRLLLLPHFSAARQARGVPSRTPAELFKAECADMQIGWRDALRNVASMHTRLAQGCLLLVTLVCPACGRS